MVKVQSNETDLFFFYLGYGFGSNIYAHEKVTKIKAKQCAMQGTTDLERNVPSKSKQVVINENRDSDAEKSTGKKEKKERKKERKKKKTNQETSISILVSPTSC